MAEQESKINAPDKEQKKKCIKVPTHKFLKGVPQSI